MRWIIIAAAATLLSACGDRHQDAQASACVLEAVHTVTWSNAAAPDTVHTSAEGPSCDQAIVVFTVRNASGDPLWTFANTYYDITAGGSPPPESDPATDADVQAFLASWANVTLLSSEELPAWTEAMSRPGEGVEPLGYESPFDRETYEALRTRGLGTICYAVAVAAVQCLVIDPASNSPTVLVAYGS